MIFAKFRHTALAACFAVFALTACAGSSALPNDPLAEERRALSITPVNHTDRYAVDIYVGRYWAGAVDSQGGGGSATCCFPGMKDWSKPVTVTWIWGTEEDPKTKAITMPREKRSVQVHFPPGGPRQDPDPYKTDAYLCVIFRNLDTVELAFAPGSSKCWDK
ncbi:DUF3304 domain-containing protein [Burkholderia humptydooensis]|uniref:DUF3304 domain-containing protein n=1 Tax=Burkholderia humptydooensis TaxID=430531 RepID=A0A7T2X0L1_9BURK|nr:MULTISPECIES: DUF3304 domain-containing protein [Burkholderia]QPS45035.1 DUF3304 domain-containing protein [Burkholderia humptydooensis]